MFNQLIHNITILKFNDYTTASIMHLIGMFQTSQLQQSSLYNVVIYALHYFTYSEIISTDMHILYKFKSIIKTHDSESRGQEEAAVRDEQVSYLHVAPL